MLNNCQELYHETITSGNMVQHIIQIPAEYTNKTGYIAFRHYNCSDWFRMNLDDVAVSEGEPAVASSVMNVAAPTSNKVGQKVFVGSEKVERSLKASNIAPATQVANRSLKAPKTKGQVTNAERRK